MILDAASIAKALKGHRAGAGYSCRCPVHNDHNPSLSVADGEDGKLLVFCHGGCDPRDVLAALRRQHLTSDDRQHDVVSQYPKDDGEMQKRIALAKSIWRDSRPAPGSPVGAYLNGRGIIGEIPATIRFHPALRHSATGLSLPAMVAAVTAIPDSHVIGIHRTFLLPDGGGKAPVSPDKMMLGSTKGGAVRLAAAGAVLAVAEGIETGLSIQVATGLPTWAALSAGGIEALKLPSLPLASELVICADNDPSGRGQRAAEVLAAKALADGREVRIAVPSDVGADFNDLLGRVA